MQFWCIIFPRYRNSGSYLNLLKYEVEIDHLLGYGVFHLDTRIHFHKIELPIFINQEFNGAGPFILDVFGALTAALPILLLKELVIKGEGTSSVNF